MVMERAVYQRLKSWKTAKGRKPLLLRGARQVGKTYSLKAFGRNEFKSVVYLNFERNKDLGSLFQRDLAPRRVVRDLELYASAKIFPDSLLILDEIQECPEALNSLKYFCEDAPEYHVAAAGSLLGVKLGQQGFPVGKVDLIDITPLSYLEFLAAINQGELAGLVQTRDVAEPLPEAFHQRLLDHLRAYFFTGGMPAVVANYAEHQDFDQVRKLQNDIVDTYQLDFAKHAPKDQVVKIATVWGIVPAQLAKENRKFMFSAIAKSARASAYEQALQWLLDAGLIHKSLNTLSPELPLKGHADPHAFKIYLLDVGLMGATFGVPPVMTIRGDELFSSYRGALTENFVAQELVAHGHKPLYYWTSNGRSEVDFLVPYGTEAIPLEVKSGTSTKHKSLHVYGERYGSSKLSRATQLNFKSDGKIVNYPLYAMSRFPELT